ncbi:hypothetical protein TAO_1026 [Candidatus Nitrosoglobus terrae]|uniref:Thiamine biosynthesis protein ThiS n=1 Tax=Candidatus Nitrosoglobus terrae TaxID=1630141 RepID=A0A1Q2SMN4_9GAMM|nr:sulfur carrier protein ThiS [Candidatus Nitrosoglobus terrae]BAW80396.1 hypothetical protein TAO_1026 [Candidatus Nitrosoglobus terrae]
MEILLNGEIYKIPENYALSDLIMRLNLQEKRIAVEINEDIIPRSQYIHRCLQSGDKVEIVHAIGGGSN